jgi:hypothetical protein
LEAFGDAAGKAFAELGLAVEGGGKRHSPLHARNHSILAHGWTAIGEEAARGLSERVMSLAAAMGIQKAEVVAFPRLVSLGKGI